MRAARLPLHDAATRVAVGRRARTMTQTIKLPDIQSQHDRRGVALDRVGVTGLYYPLHIREQTGGRQAVTARIDLTVGLHEQQRGAHLSSLVEVLHGYRERLFSMDDLVGL